MSITSTDHLTTCPKCGAEHIVTIDHDSFGPGDQDRFEARCLRCATSIYRVRKCFGGSVRLAQPD